MVHAMVFKKRSGQSSVKNEVSLVSNWETSDNLHHVNYWDNKGTMYLYRFKKLSDAMKFANNKAKKEGLKEYQVDTPRMAGELLKVK